MGQFWNALSTCQLKEIKLQNRKFTWSNEHENPTWLSWIALCAMLAGTSPLTTMCCLPYRPHSPTNAHFYCPTRVAHTSILLSNLRNFGQRCRVLLRLSNWPGPNLPPIPSQSMFPTISFTSLLSVFTHGVRVCFPTQSCISSWPSMPSFSWTEHKIFTTYPWKSGT
jgi:hypothetical protein